MSRTDFIDGYMAALKHVRIFISEVQPSLELLDIVIEKAIQSCKKEKIRDPRPTTQ